MLELKDIKKDYNLQDNALHVLKGISVKFNKSEFVSILGQSGSGKTTLLNIVGGLDHYTSGDIIINGKSTKDFKDDDWDSYRNHSIGFIFQSYNLIMHLTVLENVEIALSLAGIDKAEQKRRATEALEKVGLQDQINKRPNQLSGGQMQRVAIARSIVTNPDILLADEPTGALDSKTSIQIMEILKEISKDRLIIMVTHNAELAKKYSTRIIRLVDGQIVDDNPVNDNIVNINDNNDLVIDKNINSVNVNTNGKEHNKKFKHNKKTKTSMKFSTAMSLSFKNLIVKKWRTLITCFAGSIGIIGIALIIAVSNGFTGYINKMQSDALSNYPITISTIATDITTMQNVNNANGHQNKDFPSQNHIIVKDNSKQITSLGHYNFISNNFINYVKEYERNDAKKIAQKQTLNNVQYSYGGQLNVLSKNGDKVFFVDTKVQNNPMSGYSYSNFKEGLANDEFVNGQYDVLFGKYPSKFNEVALVINKKNELTTGLLNALGINYEKLAVNQYQNINFSELVGEQGKEFKVLLHNDCYKYDSINDKFDKNEATIELYNNPNNITLKISGILRIKEDSATELYNSGIIYSPKLTNYLKDKNSDSQIVTKQRLNHEKFYIPYDIGLGIDIEKVYPGALHYFEPFKQFILHSYKIHLTNDEVVEYALQSLGGSIIPSAIQLYPKSFAAKEEITTYLSNWNNTELGKNNKIMFTDVSEMLSNTMGQMIDIITYVLIAFASISLVVSSIMIAIITYISVLERTKEIGVLRSIGARKKDITRVFNAETFLIGLFSGIMGVVISFVLTFPISAIIKKVAGGVITTRMAIMDPISSIILIVISVLLTIISGLIPAIMAANRDPVKALRSN